MITNFSEPLFPWTVEKKCVNYHDLLYQGGNNVLQWEMVEMEQNAPPNVGNVTLSRASTKVSMSADAKRNQLEKKEVEEKARKEKLCAEMENQAKLKELHQKAKNLLDTIN